jgi:hypothetical protein
LCCHFAGSNGSNSGIASATSTGRGKNKQQTVTAIARELAGFVWSIARQSQLLAS